MAGLVVKCLTSDDFEVSLVSDDMWQQIYSLRKGPGYVDIVEWIVKPDAATRPAMPECPEEREGFVVATWRCRAAVINHIVIVDNIDGMIFLPNGRQQLD